MAVGRMKRVPMKALEEVGTEGLSVDVGGARLWMEQAGEGPAVLCLSGLGYASWCWGELQAALSSRWRALAVENRGTGRSEKPPGPYSIEQFADDAARVLDRLELAEAHVVGHSMGGYIALKLALRHPGRVRSLVLVGTTDGGAGALPVPESTRSAWQAAAGLGPAEFARRTMPLSYAPGWVEANPERFESILSARLRHPTPIDAWQAQYAACEQYLMRGIPTSDIRNPALVVHGTQDRVVPFENGARLASRLPQGRLHRILGGGHLCFLEDPEGFARLVAAHLEEIGR